MPSVAELRPEYDVLIIGAGLSGICSLYHIRKRFPSWRVRIIDKAPDVGGTWYWNQYPGCKFNSESLSYAFSFDKELLDEWHWKEAFSLQLETHRYTSFVDAEGKEYTARFFLSCLCFLSAPTLPAILGVQDFQGESFHTSQWPSHLDITRDFTNKHIGIIGTGATGIQTITALSKQSNFKSLSAFQRTANWSVPLRNFDISSEQMAIYRETSTCFLHRADPRKSSEVTDEERLALWEKMYNAPGFGNWLGVFSDTYTDRQANSLYSRYMADKIRQRVHNPATAESLIPKTHGYGTRCVPLESGYLEAYNQPNVHLVDLQKTPITTIISSGIETADGTKDDLEMLVYAAGFDAISGAFNAETPRPIWPDHKPHTFLGIAVPCMPNMLMTLGPHQPFGNAARSIERAVDGIELLLQCCKDKGYTSVEPTEQAAKQWTRHVYDCGKGGLINQVDSWMTGVNKNVQSKAERTEHPARYTGSAIEYRRRCEVCRANGYEGLVFR
ncbi:hypothetical protein G6514_005434 [Epicoccum nigrum]|nr:hypothetical protein G6514_005434 [Epicoccum nigrum]